MDNSQEIFKSLGVWKIILSDWERKKFVRSLCISDTNRCRSGVTLPNKRVKRITRASVVFFSRRNGIWKKRLRYTITTLAWRGGKKKMHSLGLRASNEIFNGPDVLFFNSGDTPCTRCAIDISVNSTNLPDNVHTYEIATLVVPLTPIGRQVNRQISIETASRCAYTTGCNVATNERPKITKRRRAILTNRLLFQWRKYTARRERDRYLGEFRANSRRCTKQVDAIGVRSPTSAIKSICIFCPKQKYRTLFCAIESGRKIRKLCLPRLISHLFYFT